MILVDTNLLVYAAFADAPEHERTRTWLKGLLADREGTVALCWPVLYAYIRLASSTRLLGRNALTVRAAWADVVAYLEQPAVRLVSGGAGHASIAGQLAGTPGLRSEDVPDVEIAAIAIENGLMVATHDAGFRRFAALRVVDPVLEHA